MVAKPVFTIDLNNDDPAVVVDMEKPRPKKAPIPEDKFGLVYWIIFLVGVICMLPWDMMVTVNGYWHYKFRNTTIEDMDDIVLGNITTDPGLTKRQKEFESYITIASSVPSAFTVISHAFVGNRFTVHGRALLSLIGMIVTFSGIIVMAYMDSDDWATVFLISNLTLAAVINVFRALFRATNSANMGKFPVKYMGSLANGVCMGGLVPVIVNIAILSMDVDIQMAGFWCFAFSCGVAITCLVLFLYMEKTDFYRYYTHESSLVFEVVSEKTGKEMKASVVVSKDITLEVFNSTWMYILSAMIATTTTSLIYPAATALVQPVNPTDSDWHTIYFSQVTCFLAFNIFNYLGTAFAGIIQWPGDTTVNSQVILLLMSVLRLAFVPILMMCNLAPSDRIHPVIIDSDVAFTTIMIVFSFSDGYINNMTMMFAPKAGKKEHQEITAGIMVAGLASSITIGSVFSNLVVKSL